MATATEEKGKEAFVDTDFELAVELNSMTIDVDSKNTHLFADRAEAHLKLSNLTGAVGDANRAIQLDPCMAKAYPCKGTALLKLEEYQTAKSALQVGASLAPGDTRFSRLIKKCVQGIAGTTEMEYINLNEINGSNNKLRIKTRVERMWTASNPRTNEVFGIDMILLDENEGQISARVPKDLINKFKSSLIQNKVYIIENFKTSETKGIYLPVKHKFKLYFNENTKISFVEDDLEYFPENKFDFIDFTDISPRSDNTYLTDVIGVLKFWGKIDKRIVNRKSVPMREIEIENGSGMTMKVTLWDQSAIEIDDELIGNHSTKSAIIITSTSIKYYKGFRLQSTSATKLYLNLNIPEVETIMEKSTIEKVEIIEAPEVNITNKENASSHNRTKLSEIIKSISGDTKEINYFTCKATVKDVKHNNGWHYLACKVCQKKISTSDENDNICKNCGSRGEPNKQYRLHMDIEDETENVRVIVFNKQTQTLLNKTVDELFDISLKDKDKLEKEFQNLIGHKSIFTIKIDNYTRKTPNSPLTVSNVFPIDEKLELNYGREKDLMADDSDTPPLKKLCTKRS